MKTVAINYFENDINKKLKYVTTNYFIYKLYKDKKFNIKFINSGFKSSNYTDAAIELIKSKTTIYRQEISKKICQYHNIKDNINNFRWGLILDTWIYLSLSKIIYETDVLKYFKKKKIPIYLKNSSNSIFFNDSWSLALASAESSIFNKFFLNCILDKKNFKNYIIFDFQNKLFVFYLLKSTLFFFVKIYFFFRKPILLTDSYFKKKAKFNIILRSFGKIIFFSNFFKRFYYYRNSKINFKSRSKLKIQETDLYDKNFNKILPYLLPINFYENFFNIVNNNNFLKKNISLLGTGISIHSDDQYKIACADISGGKRLKNVVFQHGGTYNLLKKNIPEDIEKKYSDKFYCWNNKSGLGMHNLSNIPKVNILNINNNHQICLFTTHRHPYMCRFYHSFYPEFYFDSGININFFHSLDKHLKKFFLLRLFPHNYHLQKKDWSGILTLKNFDLSIQSHKRYNRVRIFVTDHLSTPFFEALFSGVPIIVYCDYKIYGFNRDFNKLLEIAKKNKIIHSNESSAAKFINNNYNYIFEWWTSKEVVAAINKLKKYLFVENKYYYKEIIDDLYKFTIQK